MVPVGGGHTARVAARGHQYSKRLSSPSVRPLRRERLAKVLRSQSPSSRSTALALMGRWRCAREIYPKKCRDQELDSLKAPGKIDSHRKWHPPRFFYSRKTLGVLVIYFKTDQVKHFPIDGLKFCSDLVN